MPELPEVETTVRAIKKFENNVLQKIVVHNENLRWKIDKKNSSRRQKQINQKNYSESQVHTD